jgi:hypothetical protein
MRASQDHAHRADTALDLEATVQCDFCGEDMERPTDADGETLEFFVCGFCVEEVMNASTVEPRAALGLSREP